MTDTARWDSLNERLVNAARGVNVLGRLSWPETVVDAYIDGARAGSPKLPEPPVVQSADLEEPRAVLVALVDEIGDQTPVERYLQRTAQSYITAVDMVRAAGTLEFLDHSRALYGVPSERMPGGSMTHAAAAERLLEVTDALDVVAENEDDLFCLPAFVVAERMEARLAAVFGEDHGIAIVLDASLAAKAAAGANRIRLRDRTCFSNNDIESLLQHEAFVHTATARNGRQQPHLSVLGLGAPRTTATQEGLATLAEMLSSSMDLNRLRRIALRILAVQAALDGADFIEVCRFFEKHGQTLDESARSAMRIFRGGVVSGGAAFTKDVVYLHGLISVHTFLRLAIQEGRLSLIPRLFAGRLTPGDAIALQPHFESGEIIEGSFLPDWARDPRCLAAYLAFTLVVGRIDVGALKLEDFT